MSVNEPRGLRDLLKGYTRAVLRTQPGEQELVTFSRDYFFHLAEGDLVSWLEEYSQRRSDGQTKQDATKDDKQAADTTAKEKDGAAAKEDESKKKADADAAAAAAAVKAKGAAGAQSAADESTEATGAAATAATATAATEGEDGTEEEKEEEQVRKLSALGVAPELLQVAADTRSSQRRAAGAHTGAGAAPIDAQQRKREIYKVAFAKRATPGTTTMSSSDLRGLLQDLGWRHSPADLKKAINVLDHDSDGTISEEEFLRWSLYAWKHMAHRRPARKQSMSITSAAAVRGAGKNKRQSGAEAGAFGKLGALGGGGGLGDLMMEEGEEEDEEEDE